MTRRSGPLSRSLAVIACAAACIAAGCTRHGIEAGPAVAWVEEDQLAVRIECTPQDAEVSIDGVVRGTCAMLGKEGKYVRLTAGTHKVRVSARGFREFHSMVSGKGVRQQITVNLTQPEP
jgi:hypothetical protein